MNDSMTPRSMQEAFGKRAKLHIPKEPLDAHSMMLKIGIINAVAMLAYFIFEVMK